MNVEIKFDANQTFQEEAISAIVDLFAGSSISHEQHQNSSPSPLFYSQALFANNMDISREKLLSNLDKVQSRMRTDSAGVSARVIPSNLIKEAKSDHWPMDFSIEMETGTGKTYVYLKTAIELHLKYGISKFVIVVPSVAIREGVLSTLNLTKEHFREVYSGIQYDYYAYDSKNFNNLRHFSSSSHLQFLIINIAAFNRDDNLIRRRVDDLEGKAPIDFIKAVNPVIIMDEPQLMKTELSKESIDDLSPIFRLRYSATHNDYHHLVYRLSPIDAYNLKLVKRIDVLSMRADLNLNVPYIEVRRVSSNSGSVTATVAISKNGSLKQFTVTRNSDLMKISGSPIYDNWIIEDIHTETDLDPAKIYFTNGRVLRAGSNTGVERDLLQRAQIRATIEDHFETELLLKQKSDLGEILSTKPLTLFFIDRVANYIDEDSKFRIWFEEEYESISKQRRFRNLEMPLSKDSHLGYFAATKNGFKDSKIGAGNKEDEQAYDLIMKNKSKLLSLDEPVRFIFSHSALSEGWDNPNVFTICNLQDSQSEIRRRQQIGRGLRLPVMSNGERCRLEEVNHLTIVAAESFEEFAKKLQVEMSKENGIEFSKLLRDKRERVDLPPKENFWMLPGFLDLWQSISRRTHYKLEFATDTFVKEATRRLKSFEPIVELKVRFSKHSIGDMSSEEGITQNSVVDKTSKSLDIEFSFPDILTELASSSPISRDTIYQVIIESGRLEEAKKNPSQFIEQVKSSLLGALAATLKDNGGIKYSPLSTESSEMRWSMEFFSSRISKAYASSLVKVNKSIYEYISVDSDIERSFAKGLDAREDIDLFIKLPGWFKIDTPVGGYNPDWAIVRRNNENETTVHLVRETKGTANLDELFRESEVWKVVFGGKHFESIDVNYKMVKEASDLDKDEYLILPGVQWHGSKLETTKNDI
jgi:type III restriction enzyme